MCIFVQLSVCFIYSISRDHVQPFWKFKGWNDVMDKRGEVSSIYRRNTNLLINKNKTCPDTADKRVAGFKENS